MPEGGTSLELPGACASIAESTSSTTADNWANCASNDMQWPGTLILTNHPGCQAGTGDRGCSGPRLELERNIIFRKQVIPEFGGILL
jgi:hypothetical protein